MESAVGNIPKRHLFTSYLSPKATVHTSDIGGEGVFATAPIAAGEVVSVWGGHLVTWEELQQLPPETRDHPVQIWHGFYVGPTTLDEMEQVDYFNHRCEPNCGVKGQIVLVAMRDIDAGEELTTDYALFDDNDDSMVCRCGTPSCRATVTGKDWQRPDLQHRYRGWFSSYLQVRM